MTMPTKKSKQISEENSIYKESLNYVKEVVATLPSATPSIVPENIIEAKGDETPQDIRYFYWFQIGVMAFFDVNPPKGKRASELVQLAQEIYSLCDDPGPLLATDSEELVDPLPGNVSFTTHSEHWVTQKSLSDLKIDPQVFEEANYKHDGISIILIVAEEKLSNEIRYIFMSSRIERIIDLYRQGFSETDGYVRISDYGRVVHWTKEPPSQDDVDMMFDNWLFCTHFLPVKLIQRKAGG
jgi:hypothetical protein